MKETKKAKVFQLFTQGFTPSSPEVKAIGLYKTNRYKYFYEWQKLGKPERPMGASKSESTSVSAKSIGGETIGGVDETKAKPKEQMPKDIKDVDEGLLGELPAEKPKGKAEDIGVVSEAIKGKAKGRGEDDGREKKMPTRVADDGIKCAVFLSLQTLALYKIAASAQAQHDGEEELNLGDFLDTCAEDFFTGRGKKLGLIKTGGK